MGPSATVPTNALPSTAVQKIAGMLPPSISDSIQGMLSVSSVPNGAPLKITSSGSVPPVTEVIPDNFGLSILDVFPSKVSESIYEMISSDPVHMAASSPQLPTPIPQLLTLPKAETVLLGTLSISDVSHLNKFGFVIIDNFLRSRYSDVCGPEAGARAADLVRASIRKVKMKPAKLGQGDRMWSNAAVRGDEMAWLALPQCEDIYQRALRQVTLSTDKTCIEMEIGCCEEDCNLEQDISSNPDCVDIYLAMILKLQEDFDKVLNFNSIRISVMATRYANNGERYARHTDAIPEQGGEHRRLTSILYLNPSWTEVDGGQLRIYLPEHLGRQVPGGVVSSCPGKWLLDIAPKHDRFVLFGSAWLEHEVLPSYAERFAITSFFY